MHQTNPFAHKLAPVLIMLKILEAHIPSPYLHFQLLRAKLCAKGGRSCPYMERDSYAPPKPIPKHRPAALPHHSPRN